ncbi:NAD(P)-dependent dehydrogenase (short-subunit alcohol dehydrogenase family) [Leucobacter exalbidus]|uniref:NAD(P)-dependent dehydrogenase (Short-subunit alcohol dehydrogenase family) n=1 Tax=Leucobacter exalbidus TaxID=662960 RepID=A0A940PTY9_9MICO|nr:SDR family oxidoreductase [Leucobacter exalbidus]MBP1326877.1 NAD(P)-dependent dehydrogenase (short-subunit alcohol dehydrogenase family) [Leucobacter exalbidus]
MSDVLVVIGIGGMGEAIARRMGAGKKVLLADFSEEALQRVGSALSGDGIDVTTKRVDVSSRQSLIELGQEATKLGAVRQIAFTAGLSPVQAPIGAILNVDLVGVAYFLEEFASVVAEGGSAVVIASMAGTFVAGRLPAELEAALAHTPADELLALPFLQGEAVPNSGAAYGIAKRCNQLRMQPASITWGARGARVNSISPGVISTPMGQQELEGESGAGMRSMVEGSGTGRLGTPFDIAAAAAFLLGPDASFITGTDLLVDGGAVAAVKTGTVQLAGA